jgi:ferredoxin-type protein NapF
MQFLRGDFSGRSAPQRPPWALGEAAFVERCDGCGDCITACPTKILRRSRAAYPALDFSSGECLFCGDCVAVCRPGALRRQTDQPPWSLRASVNAQVCVAFRGVECRACTDPCGPRALRMRLRVGAAAIPELDDSTCTGCGACYALCPVQAISLQAAT